MDYRKYLSKVNHKHILSLGIGTLLTSYILIIIVDILNLAGSRDLLSEQTVPLLWNFLFKEGSVIEIFQWTFLSAFTIISAYIAYKKWRTEDEAKYFWSLFSIAGFLMFLEDTIDVRNYLLRGSIHWDWQMLNILETFYFLMLAAVPFYAIIKYGRSIKKSNVTIWLLALGFVFYGGAAFISGPADLTSFNYHLGFSLYEGTVYFGGEELRTVYEGTDQRLDELRDGQYMSVTYRLIDFLVEESLELLGATMLLASAVSYLELMRRKKPG